MPKTPLDSWFILRLQFSKKNSLRQIICELSQLTTSLLKRNIIDLWHYRFDGIEISLRVRAYENNEQELRNKLHKSGEQYVESGLCTKFWDDDPKWYRDWNAVIRKHRTQDRWESSLILLYYLSTTCAFIWHQPLKNLGYMIGNGVHHLFNMLGIQELGGVPYEISTSAKHNFEKWLAPKSANSYYEYLKKLTKSGTEEEVKSLLDSVSLKATLWLG